MVRPPPSPELAAASESFGGDTLQGERKRRKHHRLSVRMSAEIRTSRAVFTATTRDLSEGGAGLVSDRPLAEGEEVALGLFLVIDDVEEQMPPLWVVARVAWGSDTVEAPHTSGVRFQVITEEQKQWLRVVLTHLQEHPTPSSS